MPAAVDAERHSGEGPFRCARCGCRSEAESAAEAITDGWLIDTDTEPPRYLCPACAERAPASWP